MVQALQVMYQSNVTWKYVITRLRRFAWLECGFTKKGGLSHTAVLTYCLIKISKIIL